MIDPKRCFTFNSLESVPDGVDARLKVKPDLPYFDGHFPDQPILPAIAILDASVTLLNQVDSQLSPHCYSVPQAKFTGMVRPGMDVEIIARKQESSGDWRIQWYSCELDDTRGDLLATLRLAF